MTDELAKQPEVLPAVTQPEEAPPKEEDKFSQLCRAEGLEPAAELAQLWKELCRETELELKDWYRLKLDVLKMGAQYMYSPKKATIDNFTADTVYNVQIVNYTDSSELLDKFKSQYGRDAV